MGLLSSPAGTARVVIVDDDASIREVTEMVLAGAGHSVRATASGFEALRWLEEQPWDLLILDLRMPEIDGPTLYQEVLVAGQRRPGMCYLFPAWPRCPTTTTPSRP
jgi:CheY-like chemotaxis protein